MQVETVIAIRWGSIWLGSCRTHIYFDKPGGTENFMQIQWYALVNLRILNCNAIDILRQVPLCYKGWALYCSWFLEILPSKSLDERNTLNNYRNENMSFACYRSNHIVEETLTQMIQFTLLPMRAFLFIEGSHVCHHKVTPLGRILNLRILQA